MTVPNFLGQPGQAKNPFSEGPKKTSREDFATQFMARNESDKIAEQTPGLGIQTKKIRAQKGMKPGCTERETRKLRYG